MSKREACERGREEESIDADEGSRSAMPPELPGAPLPLPPLPPLNPALPPPPVPLSMLPLRRPTNVGSIDAVMGGGLACCAVACVLRAVCCVCCVCCCAGCVAVPPPVVPSASGSQMASSAAWLNCCDPERIAPTAAPVRELRRACTGRGCGGCALAIGRSPPAPVSHSAACARVSAVASSSRSSLGRRRCRLPSVA